MSLWAASLSESCYEAGNKTRRIQETLRYLSMPVPLSWWEICLDNEDRIEQYARILSDLCREAVILDGWDNYGLFVALAFTDLDSIEPYKYSIGEYQTAAGEVLKNNSEVNVLGQKIDACLRER